MSIEFGAIHNLVRTYQRILKLPHADAAPASAANAEYDRLSISKEAREQKEKNGPPSVDEKPVHRNPYEKDRIA